MVFETIDSKIFDYVSPLCFNGSHCFGIAETFHAARPAQNGRHEMVRRADVHYGKRKEFQQRDADRLAKTHGRSNNDISGRQFVGMDNFQSPVDR